MVQGHRVPVPTLTNVSLLITQIQKYVFLLESRNISLTLPDTKSILYNCPDKGNKTGFPFGSMPYSINVDKATTLSCPAFPIPRQHISILIRRRLHLYSQATSALPAFQGNVKPQPDISRRLRPLCLPILSWVHLILLPFSVSSYYNKNDVSVVFINIDLSMLIIFRLSQWLHCWNNNFANGGLICEIMTIRSMPKRVHPLAATPTSGHGKSSSSYGPRRHRLSSPLPGAVFR